MKVNQPVQLQLVLVQVGPHSSVIPIEAAILQSFWNMHVPACNNMASSSSSFYLSHLSWLLEASEYYSRYYQRQGWRITCKVSWNRNETVQASQAVVIVVYRVCRLSGLGLFSHCCPWHYKRVFGCYKWAFERSPVRRTHYNALFVCLLVSCGRKFPSLLLSKVCTAIKHCMECNKS